MHPLFWTQSQLPRNFTTNPISNLPTMDALQSAYKHFFPLYKIHWEYTRSSRGLLFHRSSTVTFQACYQDNERWINTVEHHRTSCEWCHLVHIRQSCADESVCAAPLWTLWRGWDPCHRRSVLKNSPQFSCFHKTQHAWGKTIIDSLFFCFFFQKVYKGTTKNEKI